MEFKNRDFWLRRLHLQITGANVGGLVALTTFFATGGNSLQNVRNHELLFIPFLLGILLTSLSAYYAALFGKRNDLAEIAEQQRVEQAKELPTIVDQAAKGEIDVARAQKTMKMIHDETQRRYNEVNKFDKVALPAEVWHIRLLFVAGLCFLIGIIGVGFGDEVSNFVKLLGK